MAKEEKCTLEMVIDPGSEGIIIRGERLPNIHIEAVDPNNPKHSTAPKGTTYIIKTSIKRDKEYHMKKGVMYIDQQGQFLTNRNVAESIMKRTDYEILGEE